MMTFIVVFMFFIAALFIAAWLIVEMGRKSDAKADLIYLNYLIINRSKTENDIQNIHVIINEYRKRRDIDQVKLNLLSKTLNNKK